MKLKQIFRFVLALIVAFSLPISSSAIGVPPAPQVTLTAKVSQDSSVLSLELTFCNQDQATYDFGTDYRLGRWEKNRWVAVKRHEDVEAPALGLVLNPNSSDTHTAALSGNGSLYQLVFPGKYRISYKLSAVDSNRSFWVSAVFELKSPPAEEQPVFCYATEPVNLRSGPGTSHKILLELETGEMVRPLGSSGRWTKVMLQRGLDQPVVYGYVFSKYLSTDRNAPGR